MDAAPATPRDYENEAWRLCGQVESANRLSLICIFAAACRADGVAFETVGDAYARDFGHCVAMQCLGHGVSWFDDHERFDLKTPGFETLLTVADYLPAMAEA
jgi:hypothetical protein